MSLDNSHATCMFLLLSENIKKYPGRCYRPRKGEDEVVHIRHKQTKQYGGQNEPRAFILPMILRDEIIIFKGGGVVSVSSCLLILNTVTVAITNSLLHTSLYLSSSG